MTDLIARLRDADTTRRIGESYADTHERRQQERRMTDIVPPCDCIELIDGQFTYRCECSNRDDGERAAAWCVEANHKAAADYDRCTIEFLRKEAAEQAAEIERLRAALREIATVTRGWEPGVWTEEEGRKYFAALFFSAQKVARAALEDRT